jgi:hypothetical protein
MSLFDPRIEKHLIADQGEVVIDEVRKHWAAVVGAMLEMFGGFVVLLLTILVPAQAWWVPVVLGGAIIAHAAWRILERTTDRFVITNMRVFRVHGILSQNIATMPLSRILDISVHKPIVGRVFGYGHFVFESAAQEQGLREIRFVGEPDQRGITIQRVIQQAGLRGLAAQQQLGIHQPAGAAPSSAQADPQRAVPPIPPMPSPSAKRDGWDWLADAQRREVERIAQLRGEDATGPISPYDPDRTNTAPIDLPR